MNSMAMHTKEFKFGQTTFDIFKRKCLNGDGEWNF